jgi:hypothetical protein
MEYCLSQTIKNMIPNFEVTYEEYNEDKCDMTAESWNTGTRRGSCC